jgi:hypothetical protein
VQFLTPNFPDQRAERLQLTPTNHVSLNAAQGVAVAPIAIHPNTRVWQHVSTARIFTKYSAVQPTGGGEVLNSANRASRVAISTDAEVFCRFLAAV